MQNLEKTKNNQTNDKNADESGGGPSRVIVNFLVEKNDESAERQDKRIEEASRGNLVCGLIVSQENAVGKKVEYRIVIMHNRDKLRVVVDDKGNISRVGEDVRMTT